jgi:hypothetical protein
MAAAKKAASKGSLKVTAPLIQVELGDRSVQFQNGDVLPDGVSDKSIDHLKSLEYVEAVDKVDEGDALADGS